MTAPAPPTTAFRTLNASNLFAQFSEQIALAAAPLVAVLLLGAGPAETGILQTAQTIPFLLLAIPAGILVDRAARRTLTVWSELLRTLTLLATLLLLFSNRLDLTLLATLGFLGAIGTVCYSVAAPAMLPALVPRTALADANRWLELCRSAAFTAGPAIGGALVGWTGAPLAYAVAAALSLSAAVCLSRLPADAAPPKRHQTIFADIREGAVFVVRHDLLRPIVLTAVVFNIAWFTLQAVYVAYAVRNVGLTSAGVGLTLGLYGGGMLAGALVAPALARRMPFGLTIVLGPAAGLVAALAMFASVWLPTPILLGISFFVFGAGPIIWTIATTTLRQTVTPGPMMGRVTALLTAATQGGRPAGAALGALVAAGYGAPAAIGVAALGFFLQFVIIAVSQVPRLKGLPDAQAA